MTIFKTRRVLLIACIVACNSCTIKIDGGVVPICPSRKVDGCENRLQLHHAKSILNKYGGCYPLTEEALRRSFVIRGGGQIREAIKKLEHGGPFKIVVIGGSVAHGYLAGGAPSSEAFVHWLRLEFPRAKITLKSLARDGTDSYWFVASETIKTLRAQAPDLVLLDYSTNDVLDNVQYSELRAVYEKIIRAALDIPKYRPALIILSLLRTMSADCPEHAYKVQEHVLEPVSSHYNVTLVSYKDAIFPNFNSFPSPSSLFDTKGVHPLWYVHQLIADTFAYAINEIRSSPETVQSGSNATLGPPVFSLSSIDDMTACSEPLTYYYHTEDDNLHSLREAAYFDTSATNGWIYWNARKGKEGWQFNASLLDTSSSQRLSPLPAIEQSIHFKMNFSETPALAITYLKSYQHFGPAIVSIDGNEAYILDLLKIQQAYRTTCERITKRGANLNKLAHLKYAKPCTQHLTGELLDPWLLNGHWDDHSSQAFVTAFTHGSQIAHDIYLAPDRKQYEVYKKTPRRAPSFILADSSKPFVSPGEHDITISLLKKWPSTLSSTSTVHNVLLDAKVEKQDTFKIMEIKSC